VSEDPGAFVIDLTKRKLIPALCNLAQPKLLPLLCAVIGFSASAVSSKDFRKQLTEDVEQYASNAVPLETWKRFMEGFYFVAGNFQDPEGYGRLKPPEN
jgi:glucose-6-phosphate 1-dehydrogenase